jgi:uncharacterized protein involved in outer membrane biogenesis
MRVIRFIFILVLILLLVVLAALAYLHFADLDRHRATIESMVTEATGREFRIAGDLELDLVPTVRLQVDGLQLANAEWGSEPSMAEIGHFMAALRPASLLFGPVEVVGVELSDVSVLVESDAEGQSNWTFPPEEGDGDVREDEEETQGDEQGGLAIIVGDVDIDNIVVTRRAPGAEDQVYRLDELTVQPDSADRMVVAGAGSILELPLSLNGQVGTRQGLADVGAADYSLTLALGELAIDLTGSRVAVGSDGTSRLEAVVRSEDLAQFLASLGVESTLAAPLSLTADVSTVEDGLRADLKSSLGDVNSGAELAVRTGELSFDGELTPLDKLGAMLGVADLPAEALTFEGTLVAAGQDMQVNDVRLATGDASLTVNGTLASGESDSSLQVEASGESLADLLTTLPALPFDLSAAVALSPASVRVDPLQARFGSSDLAGNLSLETGESGALQADLVSKRLDLAEFSAEDEVAPGGEEPAAGAEGAAGGGQAEVSDTESAEPAGEYVFRDEPLPFEMLQQQEMDVTLSVGTLVSGAATLENLKAAGSLHEGELDATADFATPNGGTSANRIQLKTAGEEADLVVDLKVRDIRANIASGDVESPEDIPPISITVDVKSSGGTPRALAANSNGSVLLTMDPGLIEAGVLGAVSGDVLAQLFSALNPLAEEDPTSRLECGIIAVDIKDGLAKVEPLMLQSDKLLVLAGGTLDLNTEKLNFEFNTKPREGVGVSADMFVTPFVSLEGTLASPGVGMNETGTLLTAGAALATGGLSLLYQGIADRATGAMDQCEGTMGKFSHPPLKQE